MSVMNCFCLFPRKPSSSSYSGATKCEQLRWLGMEGLSDQLFELVAEALYPEGLTLVLLHRVDDGANRARAAFLISYVIFLIRKSFSP